MLYTQAGAKRSDKMVTASTLLEATSLCMELKLRGVAYPAGTGSRHGLERYGILTRARPAKDNETNSSR